MTDMVQHIPDRPEPFVVRAVKEVFHRLLAASGCVGAGIVCGFLLSPFVDGFTAVTAVPFVSALAGMAAQQMLFVKRVR